MVKSRYSTISLHVLIWSALLLLPYLFLSTPENHYGEIGGVRCNYFTVANVLHIGLFYFNAFFLYPKLLTRGRWWLYLLILGTLAIAIYYVKTVIIEVQFSALATDERVFQFTFFPIVFFLVVSTVYRLVVDKINYERDKNRRRSEQLSVELKFLRSQVSPHFLFNVLNNLVSMARHKSDQLEPSLLKLAGLLRYMLYESDENKVPLETELDYLNSYIELQKLRFEDNVDIRTNIQREGNGGTIEPMLLIPFVENAFKHGVAVVHTPFIRIDLKVEGNRLFFTVENKFEEGGRSTDKNSGIGLSNVRSRLNLLYPETHDLTITQENGVFKVHLSLKLK